MAFPGNLSTYYSDIAHPTCRKPSFFIFMSHRRNSSVSSDDNPFDLAENYYGHATDPAQAPKLSKYGRTRTFSVFQRKSGSTDFFDSRENTPERATSTSLSPDNTESESDTVISPPVVNTNIKLSSLAAAIANTNPPSQTFERRRPSIVPMYDETTESLTHFDPIDKQLDPNEPVRQTLAFRRASMDDAMIRPRKFYISDVELTLRELLQNEDTNHDHQITIEDTGPKVLKLGTANSNGFRYGEVRGTYMLSNLLQELTIAQRFGRNQLILDEDRLSENPVKRMRRVITTQFWKSLTRQTTKDNIVEMASDTKIAEDYVDDKGVRHVNKQLVRIYVPHDRLDQFDFYDGIRKLSPHIPLDVQLLPKDITPEYIKSINKKPGLLALASYPDPEDPKNLVSEPYVVPGGRFNELYGWDSYMETVGLLVDVTAEDHSLLLLARGMTENFMYEIKHYGKILNANRSYYLGRSQPPFLTDMALRVFNKTVEVNAEPLDKLIDFLRRAVLAAISEYRKVWTSKPRLDEETGLSCYHPDGVGVPPETEPSHFDTVLAPYLEKYGLNREDFIEKYNNREVTEPDLDEYFLHDRAVRESGHDTSYRLEGKAAYLATVDLNALLYKYEVDIAFILDSFFQGKIDHPDFGVETSSRWLKLAAQRQKNITKYLWNEKDSMFYDYNIKEKKQTGYESATTLWPLFSRVATPEQAKALVTNSISKFEESGGIVSGTLRCRGELSINRPSRQWDYPFGWAPHQMLAWIGLSNYGYDGVARRLAYRWCFMMIRSFVDYNGVIVEKYNVLKGAVPHRVNAEYGNQGVDFKGVATEGFGWVNASFVFGLTFLNVHAQRNLGILTPPDVFLNQLHESQRHLYL